jgi:glycosyltransferase involved in cell wall biosynthesis
MGHGVDTQEALKVESVGTKNRSGILFLGRIDRIKKLEECVTAIENSGYLDSELTLVGPTLSSTEYLKEIIDLAECKKVQLIYEPPIEHDLVFQKMANFDMFFAGMKNSVDKSCLEAAACGCFVITSDSSSADLSGMKSFWKELFNIDFLPKVSEQIKLIRELDFETLEKFRSKVQKHAITKNSAEQLVLRVSNILESN